MQVTREQQIEEALKRMKALKMLDNPIKEFEEEQKINKSENGGILYWLDDEENEIVKEFEKDNGCLVYHAILNYTDFGKIYSFLYVSKDDDEWKIDMENIKNGEVLSYVYNQTDPMCSEYGYIGIRPSFGGVMRTY